MLAKLRAPTIVLAGALALAGCANMEGFGGSSQTTTGSLAPQPKIDPACVILASEIENLRGEGIADKITKAAANKYKMKPADLVKTDQLTKASAEFQAKCSTLPPRPGVEAMAPPATGGPPVQTVAKAPPAKAPATNPQ